MSSAAAYGLNDPQTRRVTVPLICVWLASLTVIAACTLSSFRLGFADDLGTALSVNGPRVLFAAGVGALLALSGALRLAADEGRRLRELQTLAISSGAAGGGFLLVQHRAGADAFAFFLIGAFGGAALLLAIVRSLDRPKRWTNLGCAAVLTAMAGIAALAGTYARQRRDFIAPAVSWLLGDLGGASFASGLALVACATLLVAASIVGNSRWRQSRLELIALSLAVGAAGPLAFVGTLAPRTVRWLGGDASAAVVRFVSAFAGAATVVAVDSVPRLLVGGYDFPWNFPAAMLAIPIFLGWNRWRLRREVGGANILFEILELAIIAALTLGGIALIVTLTRVIRALT